jgi:hypothetical protein
LIIHINVKVPNIDPEYRLRPKKILYDPEMVEFMNEAEKNLNFNPVPSNATQKKIDYFITPYNQMRDFTKFMSFNNNEEEEPANPSSKEMWKKISSLILNQDVYSLRRTLNNINDKMYRNVSKTNRHRKFSKAGTFRRRHRFASFNNVNQSLRWSDLNMGPRGSGHHLKRKRSSSAYVNQGFMKSSKTLKRPSIPMGSSGNYLKVPKNIFQPDENLTTKLNNNNCNKSNEEIKINDEPK